MILACRNEKLAEVAATRIQVETKNKNVEAELLDLADLESVRCFAERMNKKLERLDILINNAGEELNHDAGYSLNYLFSFKA